MWQITSAGAGSSWREKKKDKARNNSGSGVSGHGEAYWSTGNFAGPIPMNLQVDGAWKRIKKGSGTDWVTGAGWFASWDAIQREGKQHIFAISPIQAKVRALWLALQDIMGINKRVDVMTDSMELVKAIMDPRTTKMEIKALIDDIIKLIGGVDFFLYF